MAFLSNFTAAMLDQAVKNSGLQGIFEDHLTTDRVRAFKPDPEAYRMAMSAFRLRKEEIAFAAFGGGMRLARSGLDILHTGSTAQCCSGRAWGNTGRRGKGLERMQHSYSLDVRRT